MKLNNILSGSRLILQLGMMLMAKITLAQNIGIGTNTPTYPLTVVAQSNKGITQISGSTEVGFYTSASGAYLQTWSNHPLHFSTNNGSAHLSVLTNGMVGIGTTAPSARLDINGLVRIRGGSPSAGAVLTSTDANGNLVWKKTRIAFSVSGVNTNLMNVPANTNTTVHLLNEEFDYGNNYVVNAGSSNAFGNSLFLPPVNGLYHFDASLALYGIGGDDLEFPVLSLIVQRGANVFAAAGSEFSPIIRSGFNQSLAEAKFSKDVKLQIGDIVYLRVYHQSEVSAQIWQYGPDPHFGGHLIFED